MRIIGIDPGTAICGYGIIDVNGGRLTPVACRGHRRRRRIA